MNGTSGLSWRTTLSADRPSKFGKCEIRQHDVGVEFVAFADELSLRLDAAKLDAQAAARELAQRDLGVGFDVFDHHDSERCHGVAHSLRRSCSAGRRLTSTQ